MLHLLLLATVLRTPVIEPTEPATYTLSVRTVVGTATVSTTVRTGVPHRIEGTLIGGSTITTDGIVKTGDKSSMVLDLPDGCSVWVGPNSQLFFAPYSSNSHEWSLSGGVLVANISDRGPKHSFKVRALLGEVRTQNGAVRVAHGGGKTPLPRGTVEVGVADGTCEFTAWARPKKDGGGLIKAGDEVQASTPPFPPLRQPNPNPGPNAFIHPLSPTSEAEIKEALKQLAR